MKREERSSSDEYPRPAPKEFSIGIIAKRAFPSSTVAKASSNDGQAKPPSMERHGGKPSGNRRQEALKGDGVIGSCRHLIFSCSPNASQPGLQVSNSARLGLRQVGQTDTSLPPGDRRLRNLKGCCHSRLG